MDDATKSKIKMAAIIGAVLLAVFLVTWYIFGCRQDYNRESVSTVNDAVKQAGQDLEEAGEQLDNVATGITESTERVDRVQERIDRSQSSIGNVIATDERSKELITEGRATTAEIRAIVQGLPTADGTESKGNK